MRILVVQPAKFGDLMQTGPALDALSACHPEAQIYLLHSDVFTAAAQKLPARSIPVNLDRCSTGDILNPEPDNNQYLQQLLNALPAFDLLVNLHSGRWANGISNLIPAGQKMGHGSGIPAADWLWYNMAFIRSRYLHGFNLADIWRLAACPQSQSIPLSKKDNPSGVVFLAPGTRNIKRCWPEENWHRLIQILHNQGKKIALIGGNDERELAQRLTAGDHDVMDYCGKVPLAELPALLADASVLVGADTGIMHLGARLGLRLVSLFMGPAFAGETAPYSNNLTVLSCLSRPCYPCREDETCPYQLACTGDITPETVSAAINNEPVPALTGKFDTTGLTLQPQHRPYSADELVARFYRSFALRYFWGKDSPELDLPTSFIRERQLLAWWLKQSPRPPMPVNRYLTPLFLLAELPVSPRLLQALAAWLPDH